MLLNVEPMLDICGAVDSLSVFFLFSTVGGVGVNDFQKYGVELS